MKVNVGDLVRFTKEHREKPGLDYIEDWVGILVEEKTLDTSGELDELLILWNHGNLSDYPASWWRNLSYEPFEVISESR